MVKSMTGFGRCETATPDYKIVVEIKSVNHRYCDINVKLPKKFNAYESDIRAIVKNYAARGKVDVYISYEDYTQGKTSVKYNEKIAGEYMEAIVKASEEFGIEKSISAATLIKFPDVITLEEKETDSDAVYPLVADAVKTAGEKFMLARAKEGEHLKEDILSKLDYILTLVAKVEERSPEIVKEYREKLMGKVEELLGGTHVDESILATEITVFADKICVDEETVRLRSHIKNMRDTLSCDEAIGRKLDFVAQEMNREANTILSKANDMELSATAIDLKTEIEKIREQIQNVE